MSIESSLVAASTLSILGGGIYVAIGARYLSLSKRTPMQLPFALFWLGIATYGIADSVWGMSVPLLDPPLAWGIAVLHLKITAATVAFFGLVYYLAYLYTGRTRLLWPLLGFYVLVLALTTYSYVARDPIGQSMRTWGSALTYANPEGPASKLAFALLFVPPFLSAIAYGALLPRVSTRSQRMRVLATSAALATFFGGLALGWMTDLVPNWAIIERCLAIVAGLVVYACAPRIDRPRGDPRPASA